MDPLAAPNANSVSIEPLVDEAAWRRFVLRLLAIVLISQWIAIGALVALILADEAKLLREELLPRGHNIARNIARLVRAPLYLEDENALREIIAGFASEADIYYVMVMNPQGGILVHVDGAHWPAFTPRPWAPANEPSDYWLDEPKGPPAADIIEPVMSAPERYFGQKVQVIGYVRVGVTSAQMSSITNSVFRRTILVGAVLLLPFTGLILLSIRRMTLALRATMRRIRLMAELQRSNAELEQFAYVASHDLQEPLRTVSAFSDLLAKRYRGKLDNDAEEFIKFILSGTARMREQIQGLLEYSRIRGPQAQVRQIAMESIIKEVVTDMQASLSESGGRVIHERLPPCWGDREQLRRLFQNLISNAVKFRGEAPLLIRIEALRQGGFWLFQVKDNGIGFDPKYAKKIFLMFQRAHEVERYPGTGLGLAICQKIVQVHGGRIWAESAPGEGSTFFFTLPVEAPGVSF